MKLGSFFSFFLFVFLFQVLWSDEKLRPEAQDKAIREYQEFWTGTDPDRTKEVVWKLYVTVNSATPLKNYPGRLLSEGVLAGLTDDFRDQLNVVIEWPQLREHFSKDPSYGDVIVIKGTLYLKHDSKSSILSEAPKQKVYLRIKEGELLKNERVVMPVYFRTPGVDKLKIRRLLQWPTPTPTEFND